jgi:putative peptidoglycan lipid II flippase
MFMTTHRPFLSTTVFTIIGRGCGMVIPYFIALVYGAGAFTDAFFFAYGLIFILVGIFTHIFESALIPYLAEERGNEEQVSVLTTSVFILVIPVVLLAMLIIGTALYPILFRLSGWSASNATLAASLFFGMIPLVVLGVWSASANSIFYTYKSFWFPAINPMIRSLVMLSFIVWGQKIWGVHSLVIGLNVGELLRCVVVFCLLRSKYQRCRDGFRNVNFSKAFRFLKEAQLQVYALVAFYFLFSIDQWFAAHSGVGHLSLLTYADRLLQVFHILFVSSVLQIVLSYWSQSFAEKPVTFPAIIKKDIRHTFWISLGIAISLWCMREWIIGLVFFAGHFSPDQKTLLKDIFGWLALALVPTAVRVLYTRVLFVVRKSFFYFIQAWSELLLKILVDAILLYYFGVVGIALSTVIVSSVTAVWLHYYVMAEFKRQKPFEVKV